MNLPDHNNIEDTTTKLLLKKTKPKKIDRNEKCYCGSNVKYKFCCLKKDRKRE